MTPEQIRNQCEDDEDRAPSDLTVWRDRGEIIAAQQTRIAQLEAQIVKTRAARRSKYCGCRWCCANNGPNVTPGDAHKSCSAQKDREALS